MRRGSVSVSVEADIYIIGGETMAGVTSSVELYHNTMFVSDESVITEVESEKRSAIKSDMEVASMNTPRTEAEGVLRWLSSRKQITFHTCSV